MRADRAARAAPRVAVVVPVYRHPALLPDAIESVLAQKAPFSIRLMLVGDGCPFPETEAVCLDYARCYPQQIRYLRKPNGGLSDARNHGVEHVLAHEPGVEAIFFLDADNRLRPPALARAMAALDADPARGWIYPNMDMFGLTRRHDYGGPYSRLLHSAMNICEAGSLVRRAVFEAGVRFDTGLRQGFEDWDFFLSAGEAGFRGANLEDFGFLYRKRPESMLSEAERDRDSIRGALRQRHKATLAPRKLAEFEQQESPRHVLWSADRNSVRLTTDPLAAGETLTRDEAAQRYWLARANPARDPFPAFLTVASTAVFETLRAAGLLHFALWYLERSVARHGIAAIRLDRQDGERLSLGQLAGDAEDMASAAMVMVNASWLSARVDAPGESWRDGLDGSGVGVPFARVATLALPATLHDAAQAPDSDAAGPLLACLHHLRHAPWAAGGRLSMDWRTPDIGLRAESHRVLRDALGGRPAYPRVSDGRRHIGLTLPILEFGGVEKVALNMAAELKAAGYAVHLFVLATTDCVFSAEWRAVVDSMTFFADPGFDLWGGGRQTYFGTELPGWTDTGDHASALGMLHWLDAVIDFHGGALIAIMGQLRRLGITTISSLHLADQTRRDRPIGNPYLSLAYEHSIDLFAPCSMQLADWLHGMGVPADKIVPVVNAPSFPIDAGRLAEGLTARAARDPAAPLRVMYLGRLDPQKGLDRLATVVEASEGLNLEWRIIGKAVVTDHPVVLSPALSARLEPPLSTPEELAAAFDWADVTVLLSSYEGLPLTVLEAMRQGVVVLATDVGATGEVLKDGENGVLLPLETAVPDCLKALEWLSRDRAQLHAMSRRAADAMFARTWSSAMAGLLSALPNP